MVNFLSGSCKTWESNPRPFRCKRHALPFEKRSKKEKKKNRNIAQNGTALLVLINLHHLE